MSGTRPVRCDERTKGSGEMMKSTMRLAAPVVAGAIVFTALGCSQPAKQASPVSSTVSAQAPVATPAATPAPVAAVEHPGEAVYERACAMCHNNPEATRSPALDALKKMRFTNVSY